jgi:hypothetical protein
MVKNPEGTDSLINSEITTQPEKILNPAEIFIENQIRPLLGDEIADFWEIQTESWTQRFVAKSLDDLASAVGDVPKNIVTTDKEAAPLVNFGMEHWMLGGTVNVAGNLAVMRGSDHALHAKNEAALKCSLESIGGAQSRISWERKHELNLRKIAKQAPELQAALIKAENDRYASPLNQLNYLQKNQANFVKRRLKQSQEKPEEFKSYLDNRIKKSLHKFNKYSALTNVVMGRDDGKNFVFRYESGKAFKLWTQGSMVEEDKLSFSEPKGISVTFYRFSEETGEKEFFVCYGKRDAFARTHQFTPAWQTSISRVKSGNHPGQDYNPMLNSLKEAFSVVQSGNGVEISYIDPNPNRNNESPIAVATIDWASYTKEDQEQILNVMVKENRNQPLKHAWIPESKIAILRRNGMIDKHGDQGPAVNGFLAISLGSRSPKEIQKDGANRLAFSRHQQLMSISSQITPEMTALAEERLLGSEETAPVGQWLKSALMILSDQLNEHERIELDFPHASHELKPKNSQ